MEQEMIVLSSHYFPKNIKIIDGGKIKYYYPPKGKYLRLDIIKLYLSSEEYFDWMTIVVFKLNPSDKYTYEWFSKYLSEFYPAQDRFQFAKDYLIKEFIKNLDYFKNKFSKHNNKLFVHKEDLIKFWFDNQYKNYGVVYDFSNVPEINEYHDKIQLQCLNLDQNKNPMGLCSSTINYFLDGRLMNNRTFQKLILRGWKTKKEKSKTFFERHSYEEIVSAVSKSSGIDETLKNLGETRNGWNGNKLQEFIKNNKINVSHFKSSTLEEYYKNPRRCPICGKPIPFNSKRDPQKEQCCSKKCSLELKRRKRFERFVNRANKVHGNSYEYKLENFKGMRKNMLIHDKIFNEDFYQQPGNHERGFGNPTRSMSSGERLVYLWLLNNNLIEFTKYQYILDNEIQGTNTTRVIIDFRLVLEEKEYCIEYNGEQHYVFRSNGIFSFNSYEYGETREEQIKSFYKHVNRDNNVKEYCKSHNIVFIEIPYTKNTYTSISKILERTVLQGKPNNIKIPEIKIL